VLDGWGCAAPDPGNAVELADTPVFDGLWARYPHTQLRASGAAVGLPEGQMGNSEVGHLTIGSGRILYQDLVRVSWAIEDGSFFRNEALIGAFRRAKQRGSELHLLGLVSDGGVHSHIDHLRALLELARREGWEEHTWVHAFTDGRDVSPTSALHDLEELPPDRIATVCGRYYAMDRDKRWERTDRAFRAICLGGEEGADAVEVVRASYAAGITDEFIEPVSIRGRARLYPGADDAAIFFNFRPDRARQLSQRLLEHGVDLTTMTRYGDEFDCPVAFEEQVVRNTLAEVLSRAGVTQLHTAETEKYAHVTYFLNGGEETAWPGETRILVASPRDVPSYDHKPEMSAVEVTDRLVEALPAGFGFVIVNYANPDMVGHTGSIPAVVRAVETVDACLGRVVDATHRAGGVCLITADHGNAEQLLAADGLSPHTAHTTNPVPLVLTNAAATVRGDGELQDLAPTVLDLLGVAQPPDMTGRTLVQSGTVKSS
jgi:2,3-bisphosphoglycerate-independent phosphoglycerate mutase